VPHDLNPSSLKVSKRTTAPCQSLCFWHRSAENSHRSPAGSIFDICLLPQVWPNLTRTLEHMRSHTKTNRPLHLEITCRKGRITSRDYCRNNQPLNPCDKKIRTQLCRLKESPSFCFAKDSSRSRAINMQGWFLQMPVHLGVWSTAEFPICLATSFCLRARHITRSVDMTWSIWPVKTWGTDADVVALSFVRHAWYQPGFASQSILYLAITSDPCLLAFSRNFYSGWPTLATAKDSRNIYLK